MSCETVSVGQSETTVAGMVDVLFCCNSPMPATICRPLKKGIVEIADLIVYNKADDDERAAEFAVWLRRR